MEKPGDQGPMVMSPGPMPGGGMSPSDEMNGMNMHMSFYWGKDVIIFFAGWPEKHLGFYLLALAVVFLLGFVIEILSVSPSLKAGTNPVVAALAQTSVYAVRMAFAYLVMLSVMSYNLGIFIVAVAGHAVGHFLFKSRALARSNNVPKV